MITPARAEQFRVEFSGIQKLEGNSTFALKTSLDIFSSHCQLSRFVLIPRHRSNKQTDCLRFHLLSALCVPSESPGFASHHVSSHPVTLVLSHEINKQIIILNCSR